MGLFNDPIRAVLVDLPAGFAFDPFSSSLTDLYFVKWNNITRVINIYVEPARCAATAGDHDWLAKIDDETKNRSALVDLRSPAGRAVGVELRCENGQVHRVGFVRGPRVDLAIAREGPDPQDGDRWAPLPSVVRSAICSANTNPGTPVHPQRAADRVREAEDAAKRGDSSAALNGFREAVAMVTANWLHTLWGELKINHVLAALQLAQILARLGGASSNPGILRDAEYLARRAQRSLRSFGTETQARYDPLFVQILAGIYEDLRHLVDPKSNEPFSRIRSLVARAYWLSDAAANAYERGDLLECSALARVAIDDLLTVSVQRERARADSVGAPTAEDRLGEMQWAVRALGTSYTQFACARSLQDAAETFESAELMHELTARVAQLGAGEGQLVSVLQANALMAQAGTFLFLGDSSLDDSRAFLNQAEKMLDAAGEEGDLRANLCLSLGWNRLNRNETAGLLELTDRGLAAATRSGSEVLLRGLHALRANILLVLGRSGEAEGEADAAMAGAQQPLSTHWLARAMARSAGGNATGALEDLRVGLAAALSQTPLGQDVPMVLFAASTVCEPLNLAASLDLTVSAQAVLDARTLALNATDDRIAYGDAVRHRHVTQTLVSRFIDAGLYAAALEAADRSRARSFNQILGRTGQITAPLGNEKLSVPVTADAIADLVNGARSVRDRADRELARLGFEPPLSFDDMYRLVHEVEATVLLIQPAGERIHLMLIRPLHQLALLVAESPVPADEFSAALEQLHSELGVFAMARARSGDAIPLADIDTDRDALNSAIRTVSRALIHPIASALDLQPGDHVIIAPYRDLSLVPFPLLELPDGTPLSERYAVSIVPSLASLALIRRRNISEHQEAARYYVVGDPATDPRLNLEPLSEAYVEAGDVAALLTNVGIPRDRIAIRRHGEASEPDYRSSARGSALVHLACHASVREPVAESALFLTAGPNDDGLLLPAEIADVHIPGALVFLSACQTGLGRPTADGVLGLSRAFLEAGARGVVMSLWKVADSAAATLAHHFYTELLGLGGRPKCSAAQALQRAMLATRDDLAEGRVVTARNEVLDEHPAHWAPFLMLGDGTLALHA